MDSHRDSAAARTQKSVAPGRRRSGITPAKTMNNKTFRVLLIEDSPSDAHLAEQALKDSLTPSFVVAHVTRLDDGLQKLLRENFDAVLLDLALPDSFGLERFFTIRD